MNGEEVLPVAVIGGGMGGMAASAALRFLGVNAPIFDRSPAGFEGPWATTARMETLRSPKTLTGPALGKPSLTFRAWFESQFGIEEWDALDKIPRLQWMDYLRWYRKVLDLEVNNEHRVLAVRPRGADGVVHGPVSPRRLRAHLLALLRARRGAAAAPPATPTIGHTLGGWMLDTVHQRLERGGRSIALTTSQVQLLQCLQRHAGRLVPRAELHEQVCPAASDIRARTVDVYVHRLRRRLLEEGVHEIRIEAVRGRGFVLQIDAAGDALPPTPPMLRAVT